MKKKYFEVVKINNYLDFIFDENHVSLSVGSPRGGTGMRIDITDFWLSVRDFWKDYYKLKT